MSIRNGKRTLLYNFEIVELLATLLGCRSAQISLRETRDSGVELCLDDDAHDAALGYLKEKPLHA